MCEPNYFRCILIGVEDFNTLPTWLHRATKIKDCVCLKMKGTRLCMRETKWTAPVLKQLHEELLGKLKSCAKDMLQKHCCSTTQTRTAAVYINKKDRKSSIGPQYPRSGRYF
jgi:hypothetical protein